jgi:hypothetical protein
MPTNMLAGIIKVSHSGFIVGSFAAIALPTNTPSGQHRIYQIPLAARAS